MANSPEHIATEISESLLKGEIAGLSKAITYAESTLPEHRKIASVILEKCLPHTGRAIRVGITGVPGVGKSTFINALGKYLRVIGKKVAVLAIDPSSSRSKGSILGDKTRMPDLVSDAGVFIRPSPAATSLGGVAARTRESILLCEAAGYDCVLVETVGVGQSETRVYDMVDVFTLLLLPGGGDELQGIKRGIVELSDVLVVNKADGSQLEKARETAKQYNLAMTLMPPGKCKRPPNVALCSALNSEGVTEVWKEIQAVYQELVDAQSLSNLRQAQDLKWFEDYTQHLLLQNIQNNPEMKELENSLRKKIIVREISPGKAAEQLASQIQSHT